MPAYVDMDKLISFINESDFLKHANNLTLKNLCKKKTYEKIIAGVYKDYKQSEVVQTTCNNGRTYTDDEYNALFDSVDEVSI